MPFERESNDANDKRNNRHRKHSGRAPKNAHGKTPSPSGARKAERSEQRDSY